MEAYQASAHVPHELAMSLTSQSDQAISRETTSGSSSELAQVD